MADTSDLIDHFKLDTEFLTGSQYYVQHKFLRSDASRLQRRVRVVQRWKRHEVLGYGAFGIVWLEKDEKDNDADTRAVKEVSKSTAQRARIDYKRELAALAKLSKHYEFFVQLLGWFDNKKSIFISMEYLPLGDLDDCLTTPAPEEQAKIITSQLLEGLLIMHDLGFTHRDLKPKNIFVVAQGPDWWVKIGDFGISKRIQNDDTGLCTTIGTNGYFAPEVLGYPEDSTYRKGYTNAVDIWSLGCVVHFILTQRVPFPTKTSLSVWSTGKSSFPSEHLNANKISDLGLQFIKSTMEMAPQKRPTASSALQCLWLEKRDQESSASGLWETRYDLQHLDIHHHVETAKSDPVALPSDELISHDLRQRPFDAVSDSRGHHHEILQISSPDTQPGETAPEEQQIGSHVAKELQRTPKTGQKSEAEILVHSRDALHVGDREEITSEESRNESDVAGKPLETSMAGQSLETRLALTIDDAVYKVVTYGQEVLLDELENGSELARGPPDTMRGAPDLGPETMAHSENVQHSPATDPREALAQVFQIESDTATKLQGTLGEEEVQEAEITLKPKHALHTATLEGDKSLIAISRLGKEGFDIQASNVGLVPRDMYNPIGFSVYNDLEGHSDWQNPLHKAVYKGHEANVSLLLESGADIEAEDRVGRGQGYRPLHYAIWMGHNRIAQLLLDGGAYIEALGLYGATPLHIAVAEHREASVRLLLERGGNAKAVNDRGQMPLDIAAASFSGNPNAAEVNLRIMKLLIDHGADVNSTQDNERGRRPLHNVCGSNAKDKAQFLLTAGAEIDARDSAGTTPLVSAARNGLWQLAAFLVDRGADVNSQGIYGYTPLMIAAIGAHVPSVTLLLERGADANSTRYANKQSALHDAIRHFKWSSARDTKEIVSKLIENGADPGLKNRDGVTPEELAREKGDGLPELISTARQEYLKRVEMEKEQELAKERRAKEQRAKEHEKMLEKELARRNKHRPDFVKKSRPGFLGLFSSRR